MHGAWQWLLAIKDLVLEIEITEHSFPLPVIMLLVLVLLFCCHGYTQHQPPATSPTIPVLPHFHDSYASIVMAMAMAIMANTADILATAMEN